MDPFSNEDLKGLIAAGEGPHVSVYLPTHRAGPETRENPIRLKNLLGQAEQQLVAAGMRPTLARDLLARARALLDDYDFWQHQADGLALFLDQEALRSYRVPLAVPELAVVSGRYHVKPLLPLLSEDGRFHVLALSLNEVRVLACSRWGVSELKIKDMPRGIGDALWPDDPEKQSQFRSFTSGWGGEGQFFGSAEPDFKNDIERYCRIVDDALLGALGKTRPPLVVAAVDYVMHLYRAASRHSRVAEKGLVGNPDELRPEQLRDAAWEIVRPEFEHASEQAAAKYRQLAGTGRTANDVAGVVAAAVHGRVESLFVTVGVQRWGTYFEASDSVEARDEPLPTDSDLLDLAAVHTILGSGDVYAVQPGETPDGSEIAAVFRY